MLTEPSSLAWWHVYPLGFCGVPVRDPDVAPAPRLRRLRNWVDYAAGLGVTGLLLGPVFAAQTHGYDSLDQFRVDPRLGSDDDLDALVSACGERGLAVVLDGVFNHVGDRHPLVLEALAGGPDGPRAGLFRIDWDAPGGPRPEVFEGHGSLVALNHAAPEVADYVVAVMTHWLRRGIAGWRLDAAYAVPPGFWRDVLARVRAEFPEAWFVAEVIHGDYAGFVGSSTVDSVTQYELWKAVWSSLTDRNFFELDWALRRHAGFLERFVPATFIGNHDVTRIASRVGPDAAVLALVVLMTTGGVPSVYYGDEQALLGVKEDRLGGDDAVRPAYPDSPHELTDVGAGMLQAHRELLGVRRARPWLSTARTETLAVSNTAYAYAARPTDGGPGLRVELDVSGTPRARVWAEDGAELFAFGG
ncbi:alpha-amylase family protein [Motilibacter aurantiacus]|uniref:alpha-amylase family protein n=1 Tax=Motilibacter aurantiacus TaxID=2714955 RepID=UPI00140CCDC8|nr:alpha-amylase family protein [Motilibacter aurantiacus]NHC45099.1 alpha-amylase [Motilibacter aurantiacus]